MLAQKTSIRAFFAIDLADEIKTAINQFTQDLQQLYLPNAVRWVAPNSLHITLQFLKQISKQDLDRLIALAYPAIQQIQPFEFTVGSLQFFSSRFAPRNYYLGRSTPNTTRRGIENSWQLHHRHKLPRRKAPISRSYYVRPF